MICGVCVGGCVRRLAVAGCRRRQVVGRARGRAGRPPSYVVRLLASLPSLAPWLPGHPGRPWGERLTPWPAPLKFLARACRVRAQHPSMASTSSTARTACTAQAARGRRNAGSQGTQGRDALSDLARAGVGVGVPLRAAGPGSRSAGPRLVPRPVSVPASAPVHSRGGHMGPGRTGATLGNSFPPAPCATDAERTRDCFVRLRAARSVLRGLRARRGYGRPSVIARAGARAGALWAIETRARRDETKGRKGRPGRSSSLAARCAAAADCRLQAA